MTAKKRKMTGVVTASSSEKIEMVKLKELSKKMGVTINDILMASVGMTMKNYFKANNDKLGDDGDKLKKINILIPANIRFDAYRTRESVKCENIFAAVPLRLPLVTNL